MKTKTRKLIIPIIVLVCVGGLAWILRKPGQRHHAPLPHVIFISMDTTRPDHFGFLGNSWIKTPRMDALAAESIVFTNYMTVVPTTLASHTSLFTGKYPHTHGTPRNGFMVNQDNCMLPEILKRAGYQTAGIIGSFALSSRFGFAQGFDYYNDRFNAPNGEQIKRKRNQRSAELVTDAAISQLKEMDADSNIFLFVHYFDPHGPRKTHQPYERMYSESEQAQQWLEMTQGAPHDVRDKKSMAFRYASEVSYMDYHIGRFLDYLKKRHILDNALLVVTSDHGENFWAHPRKWNHGLTVYQSTVAAVCVIRLPGPNKVGTKVDGLFSNIDVLPTILTYLRLPIPRGIDGEAIDISEVPINFKPRTRFSQATKPWRKVETDPRWYNIRKRRCVREGNLKYIQTPYKNTSELYDLVADPYERKNLLIDPTAQIELKAEDLKSKLELWANSAQPLSSSFAKKRKERSIVRLKSLGYLE